MDNPTAVVMGDRIIPGELVQNILRFLSVRDAARTTALSRGWWAHWIRVPQLVFDDGLFTSPSNQDRQLEDVIVDRQLEDVIVDRQIVGVCCILLVHDGPITKFTLSLPGLRSSNIWFPPLLTAVFEKNREYLEDFTLAFVKHRLDPKYKLQSSFFHLRRLKHLDLTRCIFTTPRTFGATFVTLKASLVTLMLREVELDENFFQSFIPCCPLLQELGLVCCTGPNHFNVHATNVQVIELQWEGDNCASISFTDTASISYVTIMALDQPKEPVGPVELDGEQRPVKIMELYDEPSPNWRYDMRSVFGSLTLLRELHTTGKFLRSLSIVGDDVPPMHHLTFLAVDQGMRFFDERDVSSLLCLMRSSPNLRKLHITLQEVDYGFPPVVAGMFKEEDYADLSFEHLHEALFYHVAQTPEINFIKNLLAKAPVLKRFTFLPLNWLGSNRTKELREMVFGFDCRSSQVDFKFHPPVH